MQSILTLDASVSPAQLQVIGVDGLEVKVLERSELNLNGGFYGEAAGQQASDNVHEDDGTSAPQVDAVQPAPDGLKAALASLGSQWTSAVLIVPPKEYLSLNLELPFADPKAVSRVLDLEVQDRVPFDLSEFLLDHRVMGKLANNNNDVHVSAFPRAPIERMLRYCRLADVEPLIVSTPASVLEGILLLDPSLSEQSTIIILSRPNFTALLLQVDGVVRADRIFPESSLPQIVLTIRALEQRYAVKITSGILIGGPIEPQALEMMTGIDFRRLEGGPAGPLCNDPSSLPGMAAALFAVDGAARPILTNFRTREFAYRPRLGELLRGLRELVPYLLLSALFVILAALSFYYYREISIIRARSQMHTQIASVIPSIKLEEEREVVAIQRENQAMENQLKELGSPSKFSPLDLLLDVSKNFPASSDVQVRSISIKGNQIKIEGSADTYAAVETIDKALKARKSYCRVSKETTGSTVGRPNAKGFIFDIRLCE